MQFIYEILSFNRILTVSLLAWFVAQVLKTLINFILLGKFQLERMWGDGGMPSAHSATVCAMVIATARCEGIDSAIFADDRPVDRGQRKERPVPAEHASEGNGRPYSAAGSRRLSGGPCGRPAVPAGPVRHASRAGNIA